MENAWWAHGDARRADADEAYISTHHLRDMCRCRPTEPVAALSVAGGHGAKTRGHLGFTYITYHTLLLAGCYFDTSKNILNAYS